MRNNTELGVFIAPALHCTCIYNIIIGRSLVAINSMSGIIYLVRVNVLPVKLYEFVITMNVCKAWGFVPVTLVWVQ